MKAFIVFLCCTVALSGTVLGQTSTIAELIERAQKLNIKVSEFLTTEHRKGHTDHLQTLERDATAVRTLLVDMNTHQSSIEQNEHERVTIEQSLRDYEIKIAKDIDEALLATGQTTAPHTDEPTTEPITEHVTEHITEHVTESETPTEHNHWDTTETPTEHNHWDTTTETQTEHHHEVTTETTAPVTETPSENLVETAEKLLSEARQVLYQYEGEQKTRLENEIKIVNDLLVIAKDPLDKSDKFMVSVVLANQVKTLRQLIGKVSP